MSINKRSKPTKAMIEAQNSVLRKRVMAYEKTGSPGLRAVEQRLAARDSLFQSRLSGLYDVEQKFEHQVQRLSKVRNVDVTGVASSEMVLPPRI